LVHTNNDEGNTVSTNIIEAEVATKEDLLIVQTPHGRVVVSLGEGDYLVADVSAHEGAARVFVDDAEVYSPTEGFV
jgi:hypothetical protein